MWPLSYYSKRKKMEHKTVLFKRISSMCLENMYPPLLMKEPVSPPGKGEHLHLKEAHYRVRIREGDEWKTAFSCPLESFQFKVMLFGLQGSNSSKYCMSICIRGSLYT